MMNLRNSLGLFLVGLALAQSMGCCGMRTCSGWNGFGARMACAGGCGEVYVDEYLNHPPINDPCGSCDTGCDSCGSGSCGANYVGGTCQPSRPVLKRLAQFWGIQYIPSDCGECGSGGCDCGGSGSIVSGYSGHGSGDCNCGGSHAGHSIESAPMEVYGGSLQPVPQTRQNVVPEPVQAAPQKAPPANAEPAEEIQPKQAPAASTRTNRSTRAVSTSKPAPATTTTRKLAPTTTKSTSRLVPNQ